MPMVSIWSLKIPTAFLEILRNAPGSQPSFAGFHSPSPRYRLYATPSAARRRALLLQRCAAPGGRLRGVGWIQLYLSGRRQDDMGYRGIFICTSNFSESPSGLFFFGSISEHVEMKLEKTMKNYIIMNNLQSPLYPNPIQYPLMVGACCHAFPRQLPPGLDPHLRRLVLAG